MVNCPNCGSSISDEKFCPNCGTEIKQDNSSSNDAVYCTSCGCEVGEYKFCPNCGSKVIESDFSTQNNDMGVNRGYGNDSQATGSDDDKDAIDKIMDFDDKISGKMTGVLGKSKVWNKTMGTVSSLSYKHFEKFLDINSNSKYYEKAEPVFLEVLNSIDDDFVKIMMVYERNMMARGGNFVGDILSLGYTPTKGMSHDEALAFYQDMANNIIEDINEEKRNGTFDEEEFYKKRFNEIMLEGQSVFGISKSLKTYKRNRK